MNLTIEFTYTDDNDEEVEGTLPAKYEVCSRCEGTGTHTNPSIDGNGLTSSDMEDWDAEDVENYKTGVYDVVCEECGGLRVVLEVDRDAAEKECPDLLKRYEAHEEYDAQYRTEERYQRRMGF